MTTTEAAKILGVDVETLRAGLRAGAFDFGTAFKKPGGTNYTYVIYESVLMQKVRRKDED